ncbi:hypothetical protein WR25_14696 isoform A [Diploscapter pachys]|uniref:Protein PET100 homolog, mitochondrial n=1 Tax=Diploscapter pachys TaxID=2018661 RepID=A0A2A2KND6_9BILA|nr:hypothetical protein WR25_14696 isoform A [Diploscapter pachys]
MGGWRMETFRMLIYVTFPVGSFWLYNQPQFYNKFMDNWTIPNDKKNNELIKKYIEEMNAVKRKKEYEDFLRDQMAMEAARKTQ